MKKEAKEKLANVKMYGRTVSAFLLPDQMEFIETAMVEFVSEQVNGVSTSEDKALILAGVSNRRELLIAYETRTNNNYRHTKSIELIETQVEQFLSNL